MDVLSSIEGKKLVILVLLGRKDEESAGELRNVFRTKLATGLAWEQLVFLANVNVLGIIRSNW